MRLHGAISPWHLLALCALPCAVSLGIGVFFVGLGTPWVLVFAGVELAALAAALLVHARHVVDCETLTLADRHLDVECVAGGRVTRARLRIDRLVVEPAAGQGSLIELSGPDGRIRIGRLLRADQRAGLARELRHALRLAVLFPPSGTADPSFTHPR